MSSQACGVEELLASFGGRIVATRELPGREGSAVPLPEGLHPALRQALAERDIERLWSHQAETFARAQAGENVVVSTGTASGKSLGFLLPALHTVLEEPAARVLLLYPTKALAHDQLRGVLRLLESVSDGAIQAGVYDGDTPPNERKRLREQANLVLTNPDLLHAGLLPAHGRPGYAHLFRHVRWVVLDELHVYRGAFGAHVANLLRRLRRVCAHYGSQPRFLASSATIKNPRELAERLTGLPFSHVERDGSPAAGKVVHFWQPPLQDDDTRRSVPQELALLLPRLVRARARAITFCRSRKETEVVLKEAHDHLAAIDGGHDERHLLASYRGGYTPEQRRAVERDLLEGRLLGVVSTNALELGVDVGQLEVVVQGGFPGTRASFWQQLGRAGRRGRVAHGVLVLAQTPTDQFIALDPDWLMRQPAEHAVVDPDNLTVQLLHARAAAAELPLSVDDVAWFADLGEIVPVLSAAGELRAVGAGWHWAGCPFPAGQCDLRATSEDRFKVVDRTDGRTLCEMTRPQVYREAHPRAVYLHAAREYLVEELDLVGHRAVVVPVEQNFYTQPDVRTQLEVLLASETQRGARARSWFGDVRATDAVVGYKMLEFHNHQNLGYEALHQELITCLETEAVWIGLPEPLLQVLGELRHDALRGMVHAVRAVARLLTMAEPSDLLGTTFPWSAPPAPASEAAQDAAPPSRTALAIYDNHPGGIGFAAKAWDLLPEVLEGALRLVSQCACRDGCPACVGNYHLPRAAVAWALTGLLRDPGPPPASLRPAAPPTPAPPQPAPSQDGAAPAIPAAELPARWGEVQARLRADPSPGAGLLQRVARVRWRGPRLVLALESPGLVRWIESAPVREQLLRALGRAVALPAEVELQAEASAEVQAAGLKRGLALRRRHEDLLREEPASERAANARLAGGLELPAAEPRA